MNLKQCISVIFVVFSLSGYAVALDGHADGAWISLGVPNHSHFGTETNIYLKGSNMGRCAGVRPNYFRINQSGPNANAFFSLILYSAAQGKALDCVVDSGCGSDQVWVKYCRGAL